MEGNDIAPYSMLSIVTLWEGVLASPPPPTRKARWRHPFQGDAYPIKDWEAHELPMKSLVDCINRRGIAVDVYTCLGEGAVDDIDRWLQKKGVFTTVQGWDSIEAMADDLRFNPGPRAVLVASWAQAQAIGGFRATVAAADREWPI